MTHGRWTVALRRRAQARDHDMFAGFSEVSEIGVGSLAVVYRARELQTNRLVALKLLNVRDASPRALESFQRESVALGALSSHPNIVTLFRTFPTPDGRPVLVLELCAGAISDRLLGGNGLPVQDAVSIGIKVAGALETAHRGGILHRDVKPQNILVTEFGEPALADFGVAMLQSSTQTTAGLFDFTTLHAAPELLEGGGTSAATDVYELASTLYQLIAGQSAFRAYDGESPASVILRILRDPVRPLSGAGLPVQLSDLLIRAMSKDKDDRPPTAVEFAAELADVEIAQGWPRTQFLIRGPGVSAPGSLGAQITRLPAAVTRAPDPAVPVPAPPAPVPLVAPQPVAPEWEQRPSAAADGADTPGVPAANPRHAAPSPVALPTGRPAEQRVQQSPECPAEQPNEFVLEQPSESRIATPPSRPAPETAVPLPPAAIEAEPETRAWQPAEVALESAAEPQLQRGQRQDERASEALAASWWAPVATRPDEQPSADQQYPVPPAATRTNAPGAAPNVPQWAFRAPTLTPSASQFTGDLSIDPDSLRPKLTVRSGLSSMTVDDRQLTLRSMLRRDRLPWSQVSGFEPHFPDGEPGTGAKGVLLAQTPRGAVELPATKRRTGELQRVHALLDAYRMRAQQHANR
ncbi:MAG: protein kinase domain-containing protein [Jatrophihabitantaceae bacterium]